MTMTLSGDGTITGLVAGGLPDATVVQADLAAGVAGNGPAFSAYAGTGTSCPNAADTKILFDTEDYDTANCFASSRFTPNVAGYYQINAGVRMATAAQQVVQVYKNGSSIKLGSYTTTNLLSTVSCLVYCNGSTDYIEIYFYNGGTTQTCSSGAPNTYFNGFLARAA